MNCVQLLTYRGEVLRLMSELMAVRVGNAHSENLALAIGNLQDVAIHLGLEVMSLQNATIASQHSDGADAGNN